MSALQHRLIKKLAKEIPFLDEGRTVEIEWDTAKFSLPTGHYRTSRYADVYRWEVYVKPVCQKFGYWAGCWETMTIAASKKTSLHLNKFRGVIEIEVRASITKATT